MTLDPDSAVTVSTAFDCGDMVVRISYGQDVAHLLSRAGARAYADQVDTAAALAQRNAAVVAQLSSLGDSEAVGQLAAADAVVWVRNAAPELDQAALGPLQLTPGVSAFTGAPFVTCRVGRMAWQWSPELARDHAGAVRGVAAVAPLDLAYQRFLVEKIQLTPGRAVHVVSGLQRHMGE